MWCLSCIFIDTCSSCALKQASVVDLCIVWCDCIKGSLEGCVFEFAKYLIQIVVIATWKKEMKKGKNGKKVKQNKKQMK